MPREELTDAEIDVLLERFDQTDSRLQRRIIARFVQKREEFKRVLEEVDSSLYWFLKQYGDSGGRRLSGLRLIIDKALNPG